MTELRTERLILRRWRDEDREPFAALTADPEVQPRAADENRFLKNHPWDGYALWHLGLTEGAEDETKARYAFVMGDFRRIHRSGIIACHYRAAEWRHKGIELAAHNLLQYLDRKTD